MPPYLPFVMAAALAAGLLTLSLLRQQRRRREEKAAFAQLGFTPCPEQKSWLEATVTALENNRGFQYQVRDPKRLPGEPAVYYYVKVRRRDQSDEEPMAGQEILFPLERPSPAGLLLLVKPSSLAPGLATRILGAVAGAPWNAQPDDLHPLELPLDLKDTNLVAALGPSGASLYDLVDGPTLAVVQNLGDAGALFVSFRDGWCSAAGASAQIPFRVDQVILLLRPLLRGKHQFGR